MSARTAGRDDRGSTIPLVLVCFLVAAGLVIVGAAATSLHLARMRLLTVADGASLAAAESFSLDDVVVQGGTVTPTLQDDEVAAAAGDFVSAARTSGLGGLHVTSATANGAVATVSLEATWRPPVVGPLLPLAVPIEVTSRAVAHFR